MRGGANARQEAAPAPPEEPAVTGLLALILLTSARSATRTDRTVRWSCSPTGPQPVGPGRLEEGRSLVEAALAEHRPGPYQLQAAIAACHADAATAADTDWRQIAALYSELLLFDPSPVIEANRAVAVAYAEGPAAGLTILDTLAASSRLSRWPQLHIARCANATRLMAGVTAHRPQRLIRPDRHKPNLACGASPPAQTQTPSTRAGPAVATVTKWW